MNKKDYLLFGIQLEECGNTEISKKYYEKYIKYYAMYKNVDILNYFFDESVYDNAITSFITANNYINVIDSLKKLYDVIITKSDSNLSSKSWFTQTSLASSSSSDAVTSLFLLIENKNFDFNHGTVDIITAATKVLNSSSPVAYNVNSKNENKTLVRIIQGLKEGDIHCMNNKLV